MKTEQIMHLAVNYAITRGNYRECHSDANKTFLDADREILQNAVEALVQEHHARGVLAIENGIKAEKLAAENEKLVRERDVYKAQVLKDINESDIEMLMRQGVEIAKLKVELEKAKAMPMKYRRMEFNAQLQDEVKELKAELAAIKAARMSYAAQFDSLDADGAPDVGRIHQNIRAMKAELQELKAQEPVVYIDPLDLAKDGNWDTLIVKHANEWHEGLRFTEPLYTRSKS